MTGHVSITGDWTALSGDLTIISFADDIDLNTNVVTKAGLLHLQTVGHLQLGSGRTLTSAGSLTVVAASTTSSGASKVVATGQVSITGDWTALSGDLTIISFANDIDLNTNVVTKAGLLHLGASTVLATGQVSITSVMPSSLQPTAAPTHAACTTLPCTLRLVSLPFYTAARSRATAGHYYYRPSCATVTAAAPVRYRRHARAAAALCSPYAYRPHHPALCSATIDLAAVDSALPGHAVFAALVGHSALVIRITLRGAAAGRLRTRGHPSRGDI